MVELEKSFGSNTCRCTGFRPILDVIKSFAKDCSPELTQRVLDIEELYVTLFLETCKITYEGLKNLMFDRAELCVMF